MVYTELSSASQKEAIERFKAKGFPTNKWEEWKYDIFWSSRHIYDRNEFGDYHGKEFIKDQAALKLITKLLRKQWI